MHQGDSLGPVLYAMGTHPILEKVTKQNKCYNSRYLDDVFNPCEPSKLLMISSHYQLSLAFW